MCALSEIRFPNPCLSALCNCFHSPYGKKTKFDEYVRPGNEILVYVFDGECAPNSCSFS